MESLQTGAGRGAECRIAAVGVPGSCVRITDIGKEERKGMRKKYRKTAAVLLTAAMLAGGTQVSAKESAEVKLKDGQRMAAIQVVSIVGNELTYYEVEEETGGNAPQGQRPDGNFDPGQRPEETSGEGQADNTSGKGRLGKGAVPGNIETTTVYLPVAVIVHTDIGETKTFSILEAGDELEVLMQEDEEGGETIIEIWMNAEEGTAE